MNQQSGMGTKSSSSEVQIQVDGVNLEGTLTQPNGSHSIIVFVHGTGSSRLSPRNKLVAQELAENGLGTLLFDLLTARESENRDSTFNIPLLASRVEDTIAWLFRERITSACKIGLFGASTGAAAALVVAATMPDKVRAVVSRGGRPDLAVEYLPHVTAPTLLIVGGEDRHVLQLNRRALEYLQCKKKLSIVPGATHLFEEPGALQEVSLMACRWFLNHMDSVPVQQVKTDSYR